MKSQNPLASQVVKPLLLTHQAIAIIKARIAEGMLRPGDRIVEEQLAKELGLTRIPLREALIELQHNGFVERHSHKGTYVTKMDLSDAEEIYRVRTALEALAFDLILERYQGQRVDLTSVEEMQRAMVEARRRGDELAFREGDLEFHRRIWKLAGNKHLYRSLDRLTAPLIFHIYVVIRDHPSLSFLDLQAIRGHKRIVGAFQSRSRKMAGEAFGLHAENSLDVLRKVAGVNRDSKHNNGPVHRTSSLSKRA